MSRTGDCFICGAPGQQVEVRLIAWREPVGTDLYATVPRCVDRAGCRQRVEAAGDDWPIDDGTPPTYRPSTAPAELVPEPVPAEEVWPW